MLKKVTKKVKLYVKSFIKLLQLHKLINGKGNIINIDKTVCHSNLRIIINGNNNNITIGAGCNFIGKTVFYIEGNYNSVEIGSNLIAQPNLTFVLAEGTKIRIGDDCLFARDVKFRTSDQHGIYDCNNKRVNIAKSINVGKHVWIGAETIINKGASIGDDSVIGMNSIVTKEIPSKCVAAGIPAHIIKNEINWSRKIK